MFPSLSARRNELSSLDVRKSDSFLTGSFCFYFGILMLGQTAPIDTVDLFNRISHLENFCSKIMKIIPSNLSIDQLQSRVEEANSKLEMEQVYNKENNNDMRNFLGKQFEKMLQRFSAQEEGMAQIKSSVSRLYSIICLVL